MLEGELKAWRACLPERIRLAREDAELTREDLAGELDVPLDLVASLEDGRAFPDLRLLTRIAEATGWARADLLRCSAPTSGAWGVLVLKAPDDDAGLAQLLERLSRTHG